MRRRTPDRRLLGLVEFGESSEELEDNGGRVKGIKKVNRRGVGEGDAGSCTSAAEDI